MRAHGLHLFASLFLSSLPAALGATREIWYTISYARANPDGLFERRVIGVNGTWPYVWLSIAATFVLIPL